MTPFFFQLDIVEFIPSLLYFGYTTLMVLSFWLLTGTIGFYAAYMFIRKIYAAVKIDWAAILPYFVTFVYFYLLILFYLLVWQASTETSECMFLTVSWSGLSAALPPVDWRRKNPSVYFTEKSLVPLPKRRFPRYKFWIFFYYYLILTFLLHTSHGPKCVMIFTCLFCRWNKG